jgi:hypothetical protein
MVELLFSTPLRMPLIQKSVSYVGWLKTIKDKTENPIVLFTQLFYLDRRGSPKKIVYVNIGCFFHWQKQAEIIIND